MNNILENIMRIFYRESAYCFQLCLHAKQKNIDAMQKQRHFSCFVYDKKSDGSKSTQSIMSLFLVLNNPCGWLGASSQKDT